MDENELNKFFDELKTLTDKYGFTNVVFGADNGDKFLGMHGYTGHVKDGKDMMGLVMNSARLYQSGREKIMSYFDRIGR